MKFGIRECANMVFRAKTKQVIGNKTFQARQPVLYIDTATTSTLEGAATTVYAQGGRGNTRLIAWEGEKTLTFTVEDALLSPIGFSILSGAGLIKGKDDSSKVNVHTTTTQVVEEKDDVYTVDISGALNEGEELCTTAPMFIMEIEADGSVTGNLLAAKDIETGKDSAGMPIAIITIDVSELDDEAKAVLNGSAVMIDYYITRAADTVSEIQIDAENFAGYFYVEADTLFRRQDTGVDMPAVLTLPNVKIQSNFTFTMASSGDPSTFTFTMDAFPGYTYFDQRKKVLCVIQIVEDNNASTTKWETVMGHSDKDNEIGIIEKDEVKTEFSGKTNAKDYYSDSYKKTTI